MIKIICKKEIRGESFSMIWKLLFVTFALVLSGADARAYRNTIWTDCTQNDSPVTITNLNFSPNPVSMPGVVYFTIEGFSNQTLGRSSMILDIQRIGSWFTLPIPCLYNIGSCTYDNMCTLLDTMIAENWVGITGQLGRDIKTMLRDNGMNPDMCPQPPTTISIIEHPIQLPRMPSILSWFAAGLYEANVRVVNTDTRQELVCFNLRMNVVRGQEQQEEECSGYLGCWFGRK